MACGGVRAALLTPPFPPTPPRQVSNRGQSLKTLGSAFLTLLWPHEISNGKWLLYPLHLELAASPGQRAACSPAANPLRLALVPLQEGGMGMDPWPGWVLAAPTSCPSFPPPGATGGG